MKGLVSALTLLAAGGGAMLVRMRAQQQRPEPQPPAGVKGGETAVERFDSISLEGARAAVAAARMRAEQLGIREDIAVVDAGGNLKAFERMDGAWLGSIDIALHKAKTSRNFDMPTGDLYKMAQPGGPLYSITVSNEGTIVFGGGLPIKNAEGAVIGAIGCSGSTVQNDHACAVAGVDAAL